VDLTLFDASALLGRHPTSSAGVPTAAELTSRLDRFGIADALVGHTASWLHDPATGNAWLAEVLAGADRLRACWVVLPGGTGELGEPDQLTARMRTAGVAAARAYPADHGWSLTTADAAPLLDALAAAALPLFVDVEQAGWDDLAACATAHPSLRIVVCRTGYRALRRLAGLLAAAANVWVETSTLATHQGLEWFADRFGAQRLVFGTGLPLRDPAEAVTRLLLSDLDDAAACAIGGGNLRGLLAGREVPA
jgi:predicted TIM-barrel fold metal-dependent hydrolase